MSNAADPQTPTPGVPPAESTPKNGPSPRRLAGFALLAAVVAGLSFVGLRYLVDVFTHESTDDAYLEGPIVAISPKVPGLVSAVYIHDNQPVKPGDPLVDIDPRDYEATLARKRAAHEVSESNRQTVESAYALMKARLATAELTAKQSESEAAASAATAERAEADFKRMQSLRQENVSSAQEFDLARAAATAARATAEADRDKVATDRSRVTEAHAQLDAAGAAFAMTRAEVHQAETDVKIAELDLSYTRLVAPTNGFVTRKAVHVGEYVQVGQRLLAVVVPDFWVVANFKETQLQNLRPGQPVELHVDAYPDQKFAAHVDSIQAGSGARFSLLPPENAVGNFVKVVQRVPVKILFDQPPDEAHKLGPGMSVVPWVRTSDYQVSTPVLALASLVVAVLFTALVWKAVPPGGKDDAKPVPAR